VDSTAVLYLGGPGFRSRPESGMSLPSVSPGGESLQSDYDNQTLTARVNS
jgi:hypothetical protein